MPDYWFVNVGEKKTRNRDWDDCQRYGFISAGQGRVYSDQLRRLSRGDLIFAYLNKYQRGIGGYVGFGRVIAEAVMARDFIVNGELLLEQQILGNNLRNRKNADSAELADYVVGVQWIRTFPREEGRFFSGIFVNRNIVCRLSDNETLNYLCREFGVD